MATNFEKVRFACEAFSCVPYFAIVVDAPPKVWVFVLPMEHLKTLLGPARSPSWKMGEKYLDAYERDPLIKTFTMHAEATGWSW